MEISNYLKKFKHTIPFSEERAAGAKWSHSMTPIWSQNYAVLLPKNF
jgi:hypothetical protein